MASVFNLNFSCVYELNLDIQQSHRMILVEHKVYQAQFHTCCYTFQTCTTKLSLGTVIHM